LAKKAKNVDNEALMRKRKRTSYSLAIVRKHTSYYVDDEILRARDGDNINNGNDDDECRRQVRSHRAAAATTTIIGNNERRVSDGKASCASTQHILDVKLTFYASNIDATTSQATSNLDPGFVKRTSNKAIN
jgi:hypothetical protein